ncbi:hypothetical protein NQ318_011952 [Aromia moschata]|uniref:Uncharacterized protein n=1 Tax=Aromia moschata TaxID=1265417 RepID=A0AAV8XLV5_9CUCU|nr:hypothetical protein NQ318_011952 [Aromia moschata]
MTDITQHALQALAESKIKTVYLIGRRGPLQAAFTIKELREMLKLKNCDTVWKPRDFEGIAQHVPKLARPKKRIIELMLKSLEEEKKAGCTNEFRPVFYRSPLEIIGKHKVEGVMLGVNRLEGEDVLKQTAVLTDVKESIKCDLAVSSIGYKSIQVEDCIPFDSRNGIVKNNNGKVDEGVYTCGWLGTGPTGVILTTMGNAFGVADMILHDIEVEGLDKVEKSGYAEILKVLQEKNVQIVSWRDWEKN